MNSQPQKHSRSFEHAGLVLILSFGVATLIVASAASVLGAIEPGMLTRDPAAIHDVHPLFGALSILGSLAWAMTAGIWLLGMVLAQGRRDRTFMGLSLALTLYLCIDDTFMVHEFLGPLYLGIPEPVFLLTIGLGLLAYLIAFHRRLLATPFSCGAAYGLFGLSVALDLLDEFAELGFNGIATWWVMVEDGSKWLAILLWLFLAIAQTRKVLSRA